MEKNHKKAKKNSKSKKTNQPLKVVYITNPIKFKTSASEFRALVQELTGQDAADTAYFAEEEAVKVAEEDINVDAVLEEEVMIKMGQSSGGVVELAEFDPTVTVGPTTIGSYYDSFVSSLMIEEGFHVEPS